jgi:hypothetical protein
VVRVLPLLPWLLLSACAESGVDPDPSLDCTEGSGWVGVHADFQLVDDQDQVLGELDRTYLTCFASRERPFRVFLAFDGDGDHGSWEQTLGAELGPYDVDDTGSFPVLDSTSDPGFDAFVDRMAREPERTVWSVIIGRSGLTEAAPLTAPDVTGVTAMWVDLAIN